MARSQFIREAAALTVPLMFGAYSFAEASAGALTGEACLGFYRLQLSVTLQVHGTDGDPRRSAELRDLRIDLALAAQTPGRIGRLLPEPRFLPERNYPQASSPQGTFTMEL